MGEVAFYVNPLGLQKGKMTMKNIDSSVDNYVIGG